LVWRINFDPAAFEDLQRIDVNAQRRIRHYLRERIATPNDPRRFGKPLRRELKNLWRYRVGDYRLICDIRDATSLVLILRVGDRKNVYD
jgi:mRNA interferase RelE/StbE